MGRVLPEGKPAYFDENHVTDHGALLLQDVFCLFFVLKLKLLETPKISMLVVARNAAPTHRSNKSPRLLKNLQIPSGKAPNITVHAHSPSRSQGVHSEFDGFEW